MRNALRRPTRPTAGFRILTPLVAVLVAALGCLPYTGGPDTASDIDYGTVTPPLADGSVIYSEDEEISEGLTPREAAFERIAAWCGDHRDTTDWEIAGERHFKPAQQTDTGDDPRPADDAIQIEITFRCNRGEGHRSSRPPPTTA